MDFSVIFQLRTKRFWWMDVIFYFVVSLLVATVICYFIFLIKNNIQKSEIEKEIKALETVGTSLQKDHEKQVINYQKKINDFSSLFKNHGFASQVFSFMQKETRPNVWFDRFGLQQKEATVELSGQSDDNEALSRQVAVLERSEYVKNINVLNSTLDESSKVKFNSALSLDSKIFKYISDLQPALEEANLPPDQSTDATEGQETVNTQTKSSDKLMIVFKFPQIADSVSVVDLENNTVALDVPFGTDVTNLTPSIVISPKATVSPESGLHQDFTNPIVYRVTSEDGSTQDYAVAVRVLAQVVEKKSGSPIVIISTVILSILLIGAVIIGAFFIYKKRLNNKPQI